MFEMEIVQKKMTSCRRLLFTIFPIISTTNRGSQFWENREKAGFSKMGKSCRRLEKAGLSKGDELPTAVLIIEKCFENLHFIFCQSVQNLRLGSINFAR